MTAIALPQKGLWLPDKLKLRLDRFDPRNLLRPIRMDGQFFPRQGLQLDGGELPENIGPGLYEANAVYFDGSDWLSKSTSLSGQSNSKLWTGSVWINRTGSAGNTHYVASYLYTTAYNDRGPAIFIASTTDRFRVSGLNGSYTTILQIESASTITSSGWHHFMFSVDMSDTNKRHLYMDDSSSLSVDTYTNAEIDFTWGAFAVGGRWDYTEMVGYMADLMLWPGTYVDLSQESNRRLFINTSGKPVDPQIAVAALGTPSVLLTGETASWHTNQGDGGGFTENGTLTTAPSSPSD